MCCSHWLISKSALAYGKTGNPSRDTREEGQTLGDVIQLLKEQHACGSMKATNDVAIHR